jgi:hypothetical protein
MCGQGGKDIGMMYVLRYLATKAPRHQDYRIILYDILFNAWNIEINEKIRLFNLYVSPLWVFVPWWLNSYEMVLSGGVPCIRYEIRES